MDFIVGRNGARILITSASVFCEGTLDTPLAFPARYGAEEAS